MNKRWIYIAVGILFLAGAAFFGIKSFLSVYAPKEVLTESMAAQLNEAVGNVSTPAPEGTAAPEETPEDMPEEIPEATPEETPEPTPVTGSYVSAVDFDSLQAINPDIYGWLEIDGTMITYPIVQSPDDDTFYLDHNSDGNYSANGAIFSESKYNSGDLSDPVTILYGHHMQSGAMFGTLQQYYSDAGLFARDVPIRIYTPDAILEYGVFAALPYSSDHILYYNDFSDPQVFKTFFESVFNTRELGANFNEAYAPQAGDKVLILSTCLIGNNTRRFLVMATLLA